MKFSLSLGKWGKMKTKEDKWLTSAVAQWRYQVHCCLSPFEVTLTCHTFSASCYLSLFFILFKTINSLPHFLESISSLITTQNNITLSLHLALFFFKELNISRKSHPLCVYSCVDPLSPLVSSVSLRTLYFAPSYVKGNGNSLQYSCLENPMDGGAW